MSKRGAKEDDLLKICNEPLESDVLPDMLEVLHPITVDWKIIGINLRLSVFKLNQIGSDKADRDCLIDMLSEWLSLNYDNKKYGQPSWRMLAKAVHDVNGRVYSDIATKYPKAVVPQPPNTDTPRSEATPLVLPQAPHTTSIAAPEVAPAPLLDHPALHAVPTLKSLLFIKYPDSSGKVIYVRTQQQLAQKWREVGAALGIDKSKLAIWYTQYQDDESRVHAVLCHWLDNSCHDYSFDWAGLLKMCHETLQWSEFAKTLRAALIANYSK